MELWSGKKPSVRHLRTYGCLAYYKVNKPNVSKLQPRAKKGILVGYSRERRAYRIYDEEDKMVYETMDVKFDEANRGINSTAADDMNGSNENELQYVIFSSSQNDMSKDDITNNGQDQQRNVENQVDEQAIEPIPTTQFGSQEQNLNERPQRLRRQPVKYEDYVTNFTTESEPRTYKEALESSDKDKWLTAMDAEMQNMKNLQVWKEVVRPKDAKIIKSKWVFKVKRGEQHQEIYKARLVAVGCSQKLGYDYEESFSPVIRYETIRTLLTISLMKKAVKNFYDIKSAYLNAALTETVYMEPPQGYEHEEHKVYCLKRSIYGLPQSGRCWYLELNKLMTKNGLKRLKADPCVFIRKEDIEFIIVGVYVDDLIVIGDSNTTREKFINNLKCQIEVKQTNTNVFLGMEIKENDEGIILSQFNYIEKILQKYRMSDSNPVKTPGLREDNLDDYEDSEKIPREQYQEAIGSIMYLTRGTRPDLAYTIGKLSQYNYDPREIHWQAVKRVLRYLKGTIDINLRISGKGGTLSATADAGWCTTADGKSFSGYIIKLGESLISWKSGKQKMVTLSTMEAELIAVCDAQCEINFISNLIEELGEPELVKKPVNIYTDSKAVIDWTVNNKQSSRTKHINRKFYFIKDEVEKGNTKLTHKRSEELEADILTKDITSNVMYKHMREMGLAADNE